MPAKKTKKTTRKTKKVSKDLVFIDSFIRFISILGVLVILFLTSFLVCVNSFYNLIPISVCPSAITQEQEEVETEVGDINDLINGGNVKNGDLDQVSQEKIDSLFNN